MPFFKKTFLATSPALVLVREIVILAQFCAGSGIVDNTSFDTGDTARKILLCPSKKTFWLLALPSWW